MSFSAHQSRSDSHSGRLIEAVQAINAVNEARPPLGYVPPQITFGVEYEFIYAFQTRVLEQFLNRPIDKVSLEIKGYLASRLQRKGADGSENLDSNIKTAETDDLSTTSEISNYASWYVTSDASIGCMHEEVAEAFQTTEEEMANEWSFVGIELVSPPLSYDLRTDWLSQLQQVQDVLYGVPTPLTGKYTEGALSNDTTGLHVHMSFPEMANPDYLIVLKYVAIIWGVCEDSIARAHPPHRHHSILTYAQSLRVGCRPYCHEDYAWGILACATLEDLQSRLAVPGPEPGYAQVRFSNAREGKPLIIEFRQHRGTVSAKEVSNWVSFCAGVINLACKWVYLQLDIRNTETLMQLEHTIWVNVGLEQEQIAFFAKRSAEYWDPEWVISLRDLAGS